MKDKKVNSTLILTSVIAIGLLAVIAVLGIKIKGKTDAEKAETTTDAIQTTILNVIEELTTQAETTTEEATETTVPETEKETKKAAPATEKATEDMAKVQEEMTVPELEEDDMSKGKASVATASATKDLPNDMSFSGLYRQGYDVIGLKEYIFNNDMSPDCKQRKYGYNSFYDNGAKLIDFSIDTKKFKFNYDGKTYRIQIWKGQYISGDIGTVGGEVGIYTKNGENSMADHFDCAGSGDELYQEMTILWDEFDDGVYRSQLTRNYSLHWWQTGYVDGQLKNKRDSSTLRLLSHMTFKDEEQALGFATALANNGFSQVETFNPNSPNTFKIYGKDVIYLWQ